MLDKTDNDNYIQQNWAKFLRVKTIFLMIKSKVKGISLSSEKK